MAIGSNQWFRIRFAIEPEAGVGANMEAAMAAEKLSAVSAYIDREAEKLCRLSAVMYGQEVQILKLAFEQGDEVLRIPVLQKCVEYLSGSLVNITEEHLEKLGALFAMQTGKEIHLP